MILHILYSWGIYFLPLGQGEGKIFLDIVF